VISACLLDTEISVNLISHSCPLPILIDAFYYVSIKCKHLYTLLSLKGSKLSKIKYGLFGFVIVII